MSSEAPPVHAPDEDERMLHRLGYAQELFRAMGGFQNFAISFTIISILAVYLTSYYIAYNNGGHIAITWGWLLVGLMSTIVSLAMAEIASVFPTAGGLYYWSSKLGGAAWGWFTGWFNLIGQIAVTAAIGYGLAIFLTTLLNFWFSYPNTKEWTLLVYGIVMLIAVVINLFKVWITALLNTVSAYWHMVGVAFIVLVLIIVPDHHRSFGYVFGHTINNSGFGGHNFGVFMFWYVFGQGLLMSQYTITGFDASAHMAEETAKASRMAAVGMYMSVVASVFFGWILLLAVIAIGVLSFALMIPTYWNAYTGYLVGTSIAVIGLYIAFILPVILRYRKRDDWVPGAWSLGRHYKWIDPIAIIWVAFISILFLLPFSPAGVPFKSNPGCDWNLVNYAPATVGGALVLFGGWYLLSARKWFKGPVRMGSEEELERIEAGLEAPSAPAPARA